MLGAGGVSICGLQWTLSDIPLMGLYISCFLSLWCVGSFCYMVLTPLLARSFLGMCPWVGVVVEFHDYRKNTGHYKGANPDAMSEKKCMALFHLAAM